jgi:hypothetical protein
MLTLKELSRFIRGIVDGNVNQFMLEDLLRLMDVDHNETGCQPYFCHSLSSIRPLCCLIH